MLPEFKKISDKVWLTEVPLTGAYSVGQPNSFELGVSFPNFPGVVAGLCLPTEFQMNSEFSNLALGLRPTEAILKSLTFDLFGKKENGLIIENLPARALMVQSTDTKKGAYYEIGQEIDFSKSSINVVRGIADPGSGQYYVLQILIFTE